MPNRVYLESDSNRPNSIKVDGQCFQFSQQVSDTGQSKSTADNTYNACHLCQADDLPAAVDCGGDPDVIVTISGGTWLGRAPGVYRLCPFTYNLSASSERWLASPTPTSYFLLNVSTAGSSYLRAKNAPASPETPTAFTTGVTSRIQDRLFGTYAISGGITFTIARGDNW